MFGFKEDNASHNHLQLRDGGVTPHSHGKLRRCVEVPDLRPRMAQGLLGQVWMEGMHGLPACHVASWSLEGANIRLFIGRRTCMHHEVGRGAHH